MVWEKITIEMDAINKDNKIIYEIDLDLLTKVNKKGGCLCKFMMNKVDTIVPVKCPCEEVEKLDINESCTCGLYKRIYIERIE